MCKAIDDMIADAVREKDETIEAKGWQPYRWKIIGNAVPPVGV